MSSVFDDDDIFTFESAPSKGEEVISIFTDLHRQEFRVANRNGSGKRPFISV